MEKIEINVARYNELVKKEALLDLVKGLVKEKEFPYARAEMVRTIFEIEEEIRNA